MQSGHQEGQSAEKTELDSEFIDSHKSESKIAENRLSLVNTKWLSPIIQQVYSYDQ